MDSEIINEIIEELSSSLQRVETQSAAILEFVKEKGLANDDELTAYLERAGTASSVRWRATRVRLAHLFAGLEKSEVEAKEQKRSVGAEHTTQREQLRKEPPTEEAKPKSSERKTHGEIAKSSGGADARGDHAHDGANAAREAERQQDGRSDQGDKWGNAA